MLHMPPRPLPSTVHTLLFARGGVNHCHCNDHDDRVITTCTRRYPTRGWTGFNTWVPDGLLGLPTGDRWALHRRLISRFLSTNYLQGYAQEMARAGATLLAKWKGTAGQETDVQHDLGICTLEIILSVAFGIKDDTVAKGDSQEYGWNQVADHILKETALSSQEPAFFRHLNPVRAPCRAVCLSCHTLPNGSVGPAANVCVCQPCTS